MSCPTEYFDCITTDCPRPPAFEYKYVHTICICIFIWQGLFTVYIWPDFYEPQMIGKLILERIFIASVAPVEKAECEVYIYSEN